MYSPEYETACPVENSCPAYSKGWAATAFFKQWLMHPQMTASLLPSGAQLARKMIEQLPYRAKRIVELGAGTGVFTHALLERGVAPADLLALDLNEVLCHYLRTRSPGVQVVCGDARELSSIATAYGFLDRGPVDAVISGLGLLSMTRKTQREVLEAAFSVLAPDGCFIQFTYGPLSPVSRNLLFELDLSVRRVGFAWWNLPPATVYVYRRKE
jgi:phosphatidylethanolamine/phosphatidyl-N-methylethanolamine N-methyltransferase